MTAAVASPPISASDMGAPAAKATAVPQTGESFGAMLSGLDAVAAPSASDTAKTPDTEIDGVAFADAAALTAAMTNQMSWLAQIDPAKPLPPKQDAAAPPAAPPAAPAPQAAPQFGDALSSDQPQPAASPAPVSGATPQAAPVAQSPTDNATPVAASDAPAAAPPPEPGIEPAPTPASKLATAPTRPKDEKPAHQAADSSPQAQGDASALPELSSPPPTQMLSVPSASPPQTTPAPATAANPAPPSDAILGAALAAATQTSPRSPSSDKTGSDKTAAAPDAKADANAPTSGTRPLHASAYADPSPAPAAASDPSDRPAKTAEPPLEHAAKNEMAPPATNLPQTNPAPSSAPLHAASDMSAGAISNAPPTPSLDLSTPVRIAFATPAAADVPSFDALALKIATHSANGENNFSVRLDPPELGRIEVDLNVNSDGHAQASLSADKPQTLELLQKDASALERALKDAGLNLAGGMTFSLKGEGRSQAWRDMQNGSRGRTIQIGAVDAANANSAITTSAALAARAYGLPVALLDIRV